MFESVSGYLIESENRENHKGGSKLETKRTPDPEKMKVLRSLPLEVKQKLTKEEVDAFLYEEVWPDSLQEKLKDFIEE
jgi:hypothetical protein